MAALEFRQMAAQRVPGKVPGCPGETEQALSVLHSPSFLGKFWAGVPQACYAASPRVSPSSSTKPLGCGMAGAVQSAEVKDLR